MSETEVRGDEFQLVGSSLRWLWLSLGVIATDQLTKWLAGLWLKPYDPVALLPSLNLTLMLNKGAAFSFLSEASGWQRWFFVILALLVSGVIFYWLKRLPRGERWTAVALAAILGGALGNVIDRLFYGHVVDFIDVYYRHWHWPAFNIADSAITLGTLALLLDGLFRHKGDSGKGRKDP